jgi:predicted nucleic acid-binding protein
MAYLIDTNVVIYYFNGLTQDEKLHDVITKSFNISVITKIEFLGWGEFLNDADLYSQAKEFISYANVFELDEEIAEQTIALRQRFKTKTPDAIIAATALINNLTVVTNNSDDFKRLGVKNFSVKMK